MRHRIPRKALIALVVVAVLLAVLLVWRRSDKTPFEGSLSSVPANSKRVSFTDWSAVRTQLGVKVAAKASRGSVQKFMDRAYDKDLSAASSIDESAAALQDVFGFSPINAQWESYAQSDDGAVMVLKLDDAVDLDHVTDNLSGDGFRRPDKADGIWDGGVDLVATLDPTITPELQYIAVLKSQHLIVSSDTKPYLQDALKVINGDAKSMADNARAVELTGRVPDTAAGILWSNDFACEDLSMSTADDDAQKQAASAISAAGGVTPVTGVVMSMAPNRALTVAEGFETHDQAVRNLRPRAKLAVGDAIGRGEGSFTDDFRLTSSVAKGSSVVLSMKPAPDNAFVLSSLYDGPVVFASC